VERIGQHEIGPENRSKNVGAGGDPERRKRAEELGQFYSDYWQGFKKRREQYPMDAGGFTCPDTYHAPDPDETYADPAAGMSKLRAGLKGAEAA